MAEKIAEVVVVGAGPGGYVAAIRAAQLGKKVLVVERDQIGGICLNVGCIPSKALIAAGSLKERIERAGKLGLKIAGKVEVDVATLVGWKGSIVKQLTGGVSSLFKRHGIETIAGDAKLAGPGRLEVKGKDGTTTRPVRRRDPRHRLAPDRDPRLQVRREGRLVEHRRARADARAQAPARDRRRLHRARARHLLSRRSAAT
jgi:choline dehydrogenase-like flavoprotein